MIQYKPFFKLNRLKLFTHEGKVAYDEFFHDGVNIIRGQNSSGKSTIANFIFYVLGADFNKWTTAAESIREVIAEVNFNDIVITIKRIVSENQSQPMFIYWGNFNNAVESTENWETYSYRQFPSKKSFTNVLFQLLEFPELKGDVDSNITMHQILRLLYIDQKSLTHDLMLTEVFDSPITRQTVSDLLFGVYDDSLYANKLLFRDLSKELELNQKQYDGVQEILRTTEEVTSKDALNSKIISNNENLLEINNALENIYLQNEAIVNSSLEVEKISDIKAKLYLANTTLANLENNIKGYEFEINDSLMFIKALERKHEALTESLTTRESLGSYDPAYCPHCLSKLALEYDPLTCHLCKEPLSDDKKVSHLKKMQLEIENQIKESYSLLTEKQRTLNDLNVSSPTLKKQVEFLQNELDASVKLTKPTRDIVIENYYEKRGVIKAENEYLIKQLKAFERLQLLLDNIADIRTTIEKLNGLIKNSEFNQTQRLAKAYGSIVGYTKYLLTNDLNRQPEFKNPFDVQLKFNKNTFSLDGKNNFSESSNILLKNSIRFAIFFASLDNGFFRYPRFILCDNIEDKGMEEARSQNFQRLICELSDKSKVQHQIIFTTSMIAEELDNSEKCVGRFYHEDDKTLTI